MMSAVFRSCLFAVLTAAVLGAEQSISLGEKPLSPKPSENGTAGGAAAGGRNRREMREKSLINSLRHLGEWGASAVSCVSDCRYGEVKHAWKVCLDRCVDNPLLRSTFLNMLPEDQPEDLKAKAKSVLNRKLLLSRARHSEL